MNDSSDIGPGLGDHMAEMTGSPQVPGFVGLIGALLLLTVAIVAVFVALGGPLRNMFANAVGTGSMGQNQAALAAGIYDNTPASSSSAATPSMPNATTLVSAGEPKEAMERSARLTVEVANVHATFEKTYNLILERKGRVLSSRVAQASTDDAVQARIEAKVPPSDLNEIVAAIQMSGVIVTQDLQNTDHTDEMIDIASRVEDRRAAADRLRRKLADDKLTSEEFESVRGELEIIRTEIDTLTVARANLATRTDFASLEIQFVTADPHASFAFLDDFTRSLTRSAGLAVTLAGKGLSLILIALGALMPWVLLSWIGWKTMGRRVATLLARTRVPQDKPLHAETQGSIV